jgi:hypothetical protein
VIIILEGTDCAGKTTLAGQLAALATDQGMTVTRLGAGQPHPGVNPLAEYEVALRPYRSAALAADQLVLIDRWHLGELVYGPLLRGGSRLSPAMFEHVERYLDALGAVRLLVTPRSQRELEQRFAQRGDAVVKLDEAITAWRGFLQLAVRYHWVHVFSPLDTSEALGVLVSASLAQVRAAHLKLHPGYVGSTTPLLLLVGDVPYGYIAGTEPNPAFLPWGYNSAHFLLDTILSTPELDMHTRPWGLANANDGTDVPALWAVLGRPEVVALGRHAEAMISSLGVPHRYVKHPQWVRRFGYHDQLSYGYSLAHGYN